MQLSDKKLVLHIGAEKTGTTSIQDALYQSRQQLHEAGFLFPVSPGKKNHTRFITYAQDDAVVDNIRAHQLAAKGMALGEFRSWLETAMQKEISSNADWQTLILSTELIHSRLVTKAEIGRLMTLLKQFAAEIEIVFFVRRQDLLALSRFSSALRSGYSDFDHVFASVSAHHYMQLPEDREVDDLADYYDYTRVLNRFGEHVDDSRIRLEIYPEKPSGYDSVSVFEKIAGMPSGILSRNGHTHNSAASAEAQYVLARVNEILKTHHGDGLRDSDAKSLRREIEEKVTGSKRQASRAEAMAFYQKFEASNRELQERFLTGSNAPFSNDFSMYPENVDYEKMKTGLEDTVRQYLKLAETGAQQHKNKSIVSKILKMVGR